MPDKYLIVKPSSLGDIIHTFPAVSYLSERLPEAEFHWVAVPAFASLVLAHPAVTKCIPFPRKQLGKIRSFFPAFKEFSVGLRAEKYKAVIDFQGLFRSALIARYAKSDSTAGPADPREKEAWLLYGRHLNRGDFHSHAVERNMRLAAAFLGEKDYPSPVFQFREDPASRKKVLSLLDGFPMEQCVALVPGARWETKQWPPEFFAECAQILEKKVPGISFVIPGSPEDMNAGEKIASCIHASCLNLCGKTTIPELIQLIAMTKAFLCNDSGPMHIAAALNVPVTALFGSTDPELTGPYEKGAVVLQPDLACIRCFKSKCLRMDLCHKEIPPEKAAESILRNFHTDIP